MQGTGGNRCIEGRLLALAVAGAAICLPLIAAAQSSVSERLVAAVRDRNVAATREFIAEGADVNTAGTDTATALHWAAHWDDVETVRLLLEAGADPNARNRFDVTPLHQAALQNDPELVRLLLEAGADPNAAFGDGETALMTAARTGNVETVRAMLEHGGDVGAAEGWHGQTALMWAAQENHADVVQLLIEAGADFDRASTAHDWVEIEYSAGNVPKTRDIGGLTPLHFAARHGAVEAARALVAAGSNLGAVEPMYELTPLQTAIVNGHYTLAQMLLEAGADPDDGSLYLAVDTRNLGFYAQRPNPPEKDGEVTSLDVIASLLSHGADPDRAYTKGIPERTVAGQITAPPGATPLDRAATATDAEAISILVEAGADPGVVADDGVTPLMLLSGLSRGRARTSISETPALLDSVRVLLAAGADPNVIHPESGNTALHYAAGLNADRLVNVLAQYGADGNIVNHDGQTAWALIEGADFVSGASPAR